MSDHKFLVAEASGTISLDSVDASKMRKVESNFIFGQVYTPLWIMSVGLNSEKFFL
jgi:hypothetical protein